jgi:phospholipid/cholesterol/gamma-HCH transport system permease protein
VTVPAFVAWPLRIAALLRQTLVALVREPPPRSRVVAQMYQIGNEALLFIAVTLGFLGMISVYQGIVQASKVLPDYSMAGATLINVFVREFGPTVTALMIATRTGSAIAAEIGSMTVTDQVEAMKVCNTDPVAYLVGPRFVATLAMTFALVFWGILVAVAAGALIAYTRFQINPTTFLSLQMTDWTDVGEGLTKCLAYGTVIPIIAADSGFRASGGSEGVGWATTRAVVNASVAVVFLDFVIASATFVLFRST